MSQKAWHLLLVAMFILLGGFQLAGLSRLPFHPDETTWLYMSRDLEALFSRPLSLLWDSSETSYDQTYRALNAPLAKYTLGLGRLAGGFPAAAVSVDWDWSATWEQNLSRGARPSEGLLSSGRVMSTLFLLLAVAFTYLTGDHLAGRYAGLAAALFFGLNALVLLHGRRAMAEGALLFGVAFAIWAILQADRRPWLAGLAIALAVSAKQSTAPLVIVGLLAVAWGNRNGSSFWRRLGVKLFQYLAILGLLVYLLNPFLWRQPMQAGLAMLDARLEFTRTQVDLFNQIGPQRVLNSPAQRAAVMLYALFLGDLSTTDQDVYPHETASPRLLYRNTFGHHFFYGPLGGGIFFALVLVGILFSALRVIRGDETLRRGVTLLLATTFLQAAALLLAVQIPLQRYYLPLLPMVCLWAALAIGLPLRLSAQSKIISPAE